MKTLLFLALAASLGAVEGVGSGAFRDGPTLRLEGSGNETLLEKLRRLENEMAVTRDTLSERDKSIADLERENTLLRERGKDLIGRLELLEHARVSLEQARQEVADRGKRLDALSAQVMSSERARLLCERAAFDTAAEILALQANDAQKLLDLQSRLRAMIDHQTTTAVTEAR
jgi:predicted ribosome quality control (RQC) complex YloA/Tae2 family protein